MKCSEIRSLLGPYLDSELDTATTARINGHLERCPACTRRFRAEERLERGIAKRLARAQPGDEALFERVLQSAIRPRVVTRRRLAAVLLLAVAAGLALYLGPPAHPRPSMLALALRDHLVHAKRARATGPDAERLDPGCAREAAGLLGISFPLAGYELRSAHHCRLGTVPVRYLAWDHGRERLSAFVIPRADAAAFAERPDKRQERAAGGLRAIILPRARAVCIVVGAGAAELADLISETSK